MFEIIKYCILPSGLIFTCLICGSILLVSKRIKRVSISMLAAAGILYVFFGNGPISFWLLENLEYKYSSPRSFDELQNADTILILAGYAKIDQDIPQTSRVNSASAFRIMEALRLFRFMPHSEILISGCGDIPHIMKELLVSLGVPVGRISTDDSSSNTYESALNVQGRIGDSPFVLVTSAGHMPRAMGVFQKLEMSPIPAPTNHMSTRNYRAIAYLPSPLHLRYSDLAIYEYVGSLWYRVKGRL